MKKKYRMNIKKSNNSTYLYTVIFVLLVSFDMYSYTHFHMILLLFLFFSSFHCTHNIQAHTYKNKIKMKCYNNKMILMCEMTVCLTYYTYKNVLFVVILEGKKKNKKQIRKKKYKIRTFLLICFVIFAYFNINNGNSILLLNNTIFFSLSPI